MLSILIPIYNFNVEAMVTELVNQCRAAGVNFEILCFDDYSRKKFRRENHGLSGKFGVSYIELSENYGRSKIRNTLAKNARYDYLLFIDCDSKIVKSDYIKTYLGLLTPNQVINGGRIYKDKPPRSLKKRLHWKYGSIREALDAKERNKRGSANFHSNNFIIPRSIMENHPFNTEITSYGYEDVVFAKELEENKITIKNIDNQVEHLGIEYTEDFLAKTNKALENLAHLDRQGLVEEVRLIKVFKKLESLKLIPIITKIYKIYEKKVLKSLYSESPTLILFDYYRMVKFAEMRKN